MAARSPFSSIRQDLPASIVVALVALPLCLGIAVASGAPAFSGLVAGIVGGLVVGFLSKSPLSVSGPAAGLTTIVLAAIGQLPSFQAFTLAVMLAGIMQLLFGLTRSGVLAEFVPSSVINGMLAAIGLILILKQIPHALGYDSDFEGDFSFFEKDGENTFSALWYAVTSAVSPGAVVIALIGLAFLFWWDANKPKSGWLSFLPGPLVVVVLGVVLNALFGAVAPALQIGREHLVQMPIANSPAEFVGFFSLPDFGQITNATVWTVALTLAIVASLESLLSVKAIDELDPKRRTTDKNRELFAQGGGNLVSGLIGGLPVTSVIVRSSANVASGADSKLSTMLHAVWLLLSVALIPAVMNLIPLAALAAVLIQTGYKLCKPALFIDRFRKGWTQFAPFVITVVAIVFTDLLVGIGIGLGVGFAFVVARNFRTAITVAHDGDDWLVRARRNLYFIHKYELQQALGRVPDGANLMIDLTSTSYVDLDNIDIVNSFIKNAGYRGISVLVRGDIAERTAPMIDAPTAAEVRYA